uniref:Integrase catalytic domain-containing protein n=1 Tax=Vespula pensylvanica TaxID=30213 RepID=A0A834JZR9_VESPE|nr:hypothetical protein H0235_016717 [Vespula pensylvanica]
MIYHGWYRKLGYRNFEEIKEIVSKGTIMGVMIKELNKESLRHLYSEEDDKKTFSVKTIMPEKKCILILIDDYSKYIIYLLDQKSEVTIRIKDFIQEVKMIKFLRYSDRTGQLHSRTECKRTVPKRKNKSLMEMAKRLLINIGFEKKYCKSVYFANYLQNKCRLTTEATRINSIKRWCSMDFDLKDTHTFKCFNENSKEYRLLDNSMDKIIMNRDIKFIDSMNILPLRKRKDNIEEHGEGNENEDHHTKSKKNRRSYKDNFAEHAIVFWT